MSEESIAFVIMCLCVVAVVTLAMVYDLIIKGFIKL